MKNTQTDCERIVENGQLLTCQNIGMAIFDIFSKREQRRSGNKPDVFEYETIPATVRVQLVHILTDVVGDEGMSLAEQVYRSAHNALAREYGVFELAKGSSPLQKLANFILQSQDIKRVLDVVELSLGFTSMQTDRTPEYKFYAGAKMDPGQAIREINQRLREAGVGYQYESYEFIKVDSQFLHAETIKPVLILLSDKRFAGAEQEFLISHKHYREGNYKECLTECTKAFESTMKAICEIKRWSYNKTDTAKTLIEVLFKHDLIPTMLQSQFNNLRRCAGRGAASHCGIRLAPGSG